MSTYTPIASQTLSTSAPSVTFSSIPQGYTDLVLVFNGTITSASLYRCQLNGDTGSNYSRTQLQGDGSSASAGNAANISTMQLGYIGTTAQSNVITQFMNYSNSTTNKTVLSRNNNAADQVGAWVNLWRNTSAITSIVLSQASGDFASGSTFTLYGIQVGQAAQKAQGGNIVTTDGTYVYHTFTSSGSFIPSQALTADYLVVAGGGGSDIGTSGDQMGGGSGAGGMRCTVTGTGGSGSLESALSLSAGKSYSVIVGAGGAIGAVGANSVFATITSTGGGYGNSISGGSGGGGRSISGGSSGGTASPANQGFAGGTGVLVFGSSAQAGGGGGASIGGTNAVGGTNAGAAGGNGRATDISGSSVTYAGGGGGAGGASGGAGGSGGGGTGIVGGATAVSANNGTANTGGGAGGAYTVVSGTGAAGGSGIVIIRYAV
jgi:hypothetical protein